MIYHSYDNHIPGPTYLLFAVPVIAQPTIPMQRSSATLSRISFVSLNGYTTSGSEKRSSGLQQVVHCVVGHIVAFDTLSPSMQRKSRNTRERRYFWSPKRKCIS